MKRIILQLLLIIFTINTFAQQGNCFIELIAEPGIKVYIDNTLIGTTNKEENGLFIQNINTGNHIIEFIKVNFESQKDIINIKSGKALLYRIKPFKTRFKISQEGDFEKNKLFQKTGNLVLESIPKSINVDIPSLGANIKKTKNLLNIKNISIGAYNAIFTWKNKQINYKINIHHKKTTHLTINMLNGKIDNLIYKEKFAKTGKIKENKVFLKFFYNFISSLKIQKENVLYPILINNVQISKPTEYCFFPLYKGSSVSAHLSQDSIGIYNGVHTSDTIIVSRLSIKNMSDNRFIFVDHNSKWTLVSNKKIKLENSPQQEFFNFLAYFSKDSIFQKEHIKFPLDYQSRDASNDFKLVKTNIEKNKWRFYNYQSLFEKIFFLNERNINSRHKILYFNGIENGISFNLYFKKINYKWKLIKILDEST